MPQTNINIRMDEDLKNQFNTLCMDLGLTMTAAFSVFAKAAVRQKKIPFELTTVAAPLNSGTGDRQIEAGMWAFAEKHYAGRTLRELIQEGLDDMEAGVCRPAGEVFKELERKQESRPA